MKKLIKSSPDGVKDLLFKECIIRRDLENRLKEIFSLRGYHEVITPGLEYYDIFSFANSYMPLETMYKLTDLGGSLLVLRPDITVPIARVVTSHLKDARPPIKLSYNQNIFKLTPNLSGQRNEIAQSGVELIGAAGIKADLEIIACAAEAMKLMGDFCQGVIRFEIGHANFPKALISKLPLSYEEQEDINGLIKAKNYAKLNDALYKYKEHPAVKGIMRLPRLFGGIEVLKEARGLSDDDEMLETIQYIEKIYGYMSELGINKNVIIDLGLAPDNVYYTGIVFRGYMDGLGMPVLSGGRYDKLYEEFGMDMPATGFAIYVDEAVQSAINGKNKAEIKSFVIHAEKGWEVKAFKYSDSLRAQKIPCEISAYDGLEQSLCYAKAIKAYNFVTVGKDVKFIIKDGVYEAN